MKVYVPYPCVGSVSISYRYPTLLWVLEYEHALPGIHKPYEYIRARLLEDDCVFVFNSILFFSSNLICMWLIEKWIFKQAFSNASNSTKGSVFGLFCSISSFDLGSLSNSTWRVPWNRSKPRKLMLCLRLLQANNYRSRKQKTKQVVPLWCWIWNPHKAMASLVLFNRSRKNVLFAHSTSPLLQFPASQDTCHHHLRERVLHCAESPRCQVWGP